MNNHNVYGVFVNNSYNIMYIQIIINIIQMNYRLIEKYVIINIVKDQINCIYKCFNK